MRGRSTASFAPARAAGACLFLGLVSSAPASAQQTRVADAQPTAGETPQSKLRTLQQAIEASEGRRKALANDIDTFRTDRAKFQSQLIELTAKVAADEAKLSDATTRLGRLAGQQDEQRHALDARRAQVAEVLAVLQRMNRKPPPALLVEPEDVLKAIRTSMLLGAVLPGMRKQMETVAHDLADLVRTRQAVEDERRSADQQVTALRAERNRLSDLIEARQVALGKAQADLAGERERATRMAEQAGSLKELIGRMEREGGLASQAAAAAQSSDRRLAALGAGAAKGMPFKDPGRLAPAVAFANTRGALPQPVSGTVLRHYGEDDGTGGTEKGTLFETSAKAVVASPADGWVAYAGPYRSWGQLLILNVGDGYYIVLAGMDRVNVSLGQFVLAGEPVAAMGDGSTKTAAAIALGAAQPVLYVEFRKDGATIDPGPWWAKPELQKVRG